MKRRLKKVSRVVAMGLVASLCLALLAQNIARAGPPTPEPHLKKKFLNSTAEFQAGHRSPFAPLLSQSGPSLASTLTVEATADTFVASGPDVRDENFGDWDEMYVGYDKIFDFKKERSLVQFDLSSIPSNATINSATLRLFLYSYVYPTGGSTTMNVKTYRIKEAWSEYDVTWSNQPEHGESYGSASVGTEFTWYSFDVTDLVRKWMSGGKPNYGIMLRGDESEGYHERSFETSEGWDEPELVIDYTVPDYTPPTSQVDPLPPYSNQTPFTVSWSGTDDISGIQSYAVQYRIDMGAWTDWQLCTTYTSLPFNGQHDHTYYFRVRARDNAGNLEDYPPGDGDTWTTVDLHPPTSQVAPLPRYLNYSPFTVSWSGTDDISGIQSYAVQYRIDTGAWTDWQTLTTYTTLPFNGQHAHTYYFRVRARDNAGNLEDYPPGDGDTLTTLDMTPPTSSVNPLPETQAHTWFVVTWSGSDDISGVASYDAQYRLGPEGSWTDWLQDTLSTSGLFLHATPGQVYCFHARATDRAGNVEAYSPGAEVCMTAGPDPSGLSQVHFPICMKNSP